MSRNQPAFERARPRTPPRRHLVWLVLALALGACRSAAPPTLLGKSRPFTFRVEGNREISAAELERAISFELDEYQSGDYDAAFADDARYQALLHYHQAGFPNAQVEFRQLLDERPPGLLLRVDEGSRVVVDLGAFETKGVKEFSREEVLSFLNAPRTGLLGRGDPLYVAEAIANMRAGLEREYLARGYRDVKVPPPDVTLTEDGTRARVKLTVTEGTRYVSGRVQLVEEGLPDHLRDHLRRLCAQFSFLRAAGQTKPLRAEDGRRIRRAFTPRVPFELRGELLEALGNAAFPEAEVDVEVRPREGDVGKEVGLVDLVVTVLLGPRIEVGDVRVVGAEQTREGLVLSRLRFDSGDRWSNEDVRAGVRELYRTSLFRRVDLDKVRPEGEEGRTQRRDVVVNLVEAPTREFFVEPGYGSWELFRLRAGMRDRNLWGTGRQLRVEGTAAVRKTRGLVSLRDPWLFESDVDLIGDLSLSYDERENPSFTSRSTGAGAFVTKEWSDRESSTLGYQYRRSEALQIEVVDEEALETLENVDISSLRLSHRRDLRDNPLLPSENTFVEGGVEWGGKALGSELEFVRGTFSVAGYWRVIERTVLATSYRTGVIQPLGNDDVVPIQERFFNGGENSVRSFQQDRLGPTDEDDNPTGGEAFHVFNLELRRPLGDSRVEIASFVDAGNLEETARDWAGLNDVRYGVGLGLRYVLPVGPIRLDVAANPDPRSGEDDVVVHFAVGIAF